jgi:hypothetical protein
MFNSVQSHARLLDEDGESVGAVPRRAGNHEHHNGIVTVTLRNADRPRCRTLVQLVSFDQDYTRLAKFLTLCRERRVQMVE